MADENIMSIQCEDQETLSCTEDGNLHNVQIQSLLRHMKISNEFVKIRESMEIFPLPGNEMEPQQFANDQGFVNQAKAGDNRRGMRATDLLMTFSLSADFNKHKIVELVENAVNEVTKMLTEGEPLWQHDIRGIETLNKDEYVKTFHSNLETTLDEIIKIIAVDAPLDLPDLDGTINNDSKPFIEDDGVSKPHFRLSKQCHASRCIGYPQMPAACIVEILVDVRLWSFVFSELLSRAAVLGILSPGAEETYDGALQVMTSECHAPSPLHPTWKSCFARYCKLLSTNMWIIIDVSLESLLDNPLMNKKIKPSGILIEGSLDGNSAKVTWLEHTEAEITDNHPLFKSILDSGLFFDAKLWVNTLVQQCHHTNLIIQHSHSVSKGIGLFQEEGLLRLAARMRRQFYGVVSATKGNSYKPLPIKGGDDILIKTLDNDDQSPLLFTVTMSTWFPFAHHKIFKFLGNKENRTKWDVLGLNCDSEEIFRVHSGQGPEDIVSITKMMGQDGEVDTVFLCDKHETTIGSYIIFSPMTYNCMTSLANCQNIDEIPLLSSGFAILSNERQGRENDSKGTVVKICFQLLDSSSKKKNVTSKTSRKLYNLMTNTISSIRAALFEPLTFENQDA